MQAIDKVRQYFNKTTLPHTKAAADWTNPPARLALPARMPDIVSHFQGVKGLIRTLQAELSRHGSSLQKAGRIHVVYPHKHPVLFPNHRNNAENTARELVKALQKAAPKTEWLPADALCETVHLGRSENLTILHALTGKQIYTVDNATSMRPFLPRAEGRTEFFILTDSSIDIGTTLSNMASYIHHNGGVVLAASYNGEAKPLRQSAGKMPPRDIRALKLAPVFNDRQRNTGRLAEVAVALHETAPSGAGMTPASCLEAFEAALNKCGNTVFSMTDGECNRLIATLRGQHYERNSFNGLVAGLERRAVELKEEAQARRDLQFLTGM